MAELAPAAVADVAIEVVADVAIVGGGVAGCAAALMLRHHAPHLRVWVGEVSSYDRPQLGESLPPLALQLLRRLGLGHALAEAVSVGLARRAHGVEILWGSSRPAYEDFLLRAKGSGLHLDRARFGAWLASICEARGVDLRRGVRVREVEPTSDGRVRLCGSGASGRVTVTASVVLDACGRTAPIAGRLGARVDAEDTLVAVARYFGPAAAREDPRLTVESFGDGWWYAAGLPDDRLVVVALSDADLVRRLDLRTESAWSSHCPPAIAGRLLGRASQGPPIVRSAACGRLDRAAGLVGGAGGRAAWLAVGDAASAFDPLSSQGMAKALRSGIFAAYAASDFLADPCRETAPLERYARFVADEFAAFLKTRREVYATETRWPERPFWARRTASQEAPSPAWPAKIEAASGLEGGRP